MGIWVQADIDVLRAAVAGGVLTVTYDGPPRRSITYQSLAEMRSLLAAMNKDVTAAPSARRVRTSKGFRGNGGGGTNWGDGR
jgi:hypothetical protein